MSRRKPNNRRGNSSKPNFKKEDELKSKTNEPSWYAADPALLRDVASFPFSRPVGTRVGWNFRKYTTGTGTTTQWPKCSVPGIARMTLIPTCGNSNDGTSAVNVAAQAMYSFVRHANSGHANYEYADLMIYMLANSQVYGMINYLQRIYGTALMYSQRNRWVPKYLLECDGIDFDDVMTNLANFRYGINLLINKASALAVPRSFTLFNRHAFLFQNYYIEGESIKDQIYFYSPEYFFIFGINELDSSGQLMPNKAIDGIDFAGRDYSHKLKCEELLTYANTLIDAILNEEDFGIMSGDILKAYGEDIIKLQSLDEVYSLDFVKDDYVLLQFKNSSPLFGQTQRLTDVNIYQLNGVIMYQPTVNIDAGAYATEYSDVLEDIYENERPITFNKVEVANEDVIEATRLTMCMAPNAIQQNRPLLIHGSEISCRMSYFMISIPDGGTGTGIISVDVPYVDIPTGSDGDKRRKTGFAAGILSSFRFHPLYLEANMASGNTEGNTKWVAYPPVFDFDNYTMISADEIQRMHDACLFNMLHVPAVAKAYKG